MMLLVVFQVACTCLSCCKSGYLAKDLLMVLIPFDPILFNRLNSVSTTTLVMMKICVIVRWMRDLSFEMNVRDETSVLN